ncbi:hypothetical protein LguiB_020884 [Lonicera macranthoides]
MTFDSSSSSSTNKTKVCINKSEIRCCMIYNNLVFKQSTFNNRISLSSLSRTFTSVATPPPIARNHRPSLHRLTHSSAPFLFLCRRAFSSTSSLLLYPSLQVLAATQTRGEVGMNWFQGTADAVRQFTWVFEEKKQGGGESAVTEEKRQGGGVRWMVVSSGGRWSGDKSESP